MMKNVLIVLTLSLLASCASSPEEAFQRDGVSFISPEGWEITDTDSLDGAGYYLSVEKDGVRSSGLFVLTWIDGILNLDEWIDTYRQSLSEEETYEDAVGIDKESVPGNYAGCEGEMINFTVDFLSIEHDAKFYAFHKGGKTFGVFIQEAIEDAEDNLEGFKLIERSFNVKE